MSASNRKVIRNKPTMRSSCHSPAVPQMRSRTPDRIIADHRGIARSSLGISLSELQAPVVHRLIGNCYPALIHHLLHVTEAEGEAEIQPHAVADDLRGETMAVIRRRGRVHAPSKSPVP